MRRFELVNLARNHSKFWEIWRVGHEVFVRYGRIGAPNGATDSWEYSSSGAAMAQLETKVAQKTGRGYAEVSNPNVKATAFVKGVPDDDEPAIDAPVPAQKRRKTKWSEVLDQC